jgi:hypothetical protein
MSVVLQVVAGQSLPEAPYPPDTRVRGWRFQFDHERLNQSDTWAIAPADQRPWLLMLWLTAWQQVPAGSMPADDQIIAAKIGMDQRQFSAHKDILLRGWVAYRDGRLYHPVIVEQVQEYLGVRNRERERKAKYRDKMSDVPRDRHGTDVGKTLPEPEPEPVINTHASHESPKNSVLGRSPVPFSEIRDAWIEALPELTKPIGVEHWTPNRRAQLAARWRDQLPDLDAWLDLFARIRRSDFLMGRIKPFRCDLFWITKPENLLKLYEGKYDNASTAGR